MEITTELKAKVIRALEKFQGVAYDYEIAHETGLSIEEVHIVMESLVEWGLIFRG